MNLDKLVRAGQPPWRPTPKADEVDPWEKYDFPTCGTYRLDGTLIVFALITTAGDRSLWAYVPAGPSATELIESEHMFATVDEYKTFIDDCFTGHEVIFAAAENLVISTKSDGVPIPPIRNALIVAATKWYLERSAALNAGLQKNLAAATEANDSSTLVRTAQSALASLPV